MSDQTLPPAKPFWRSGLKSVGSALTAGPRHMTRTVFRLGASTAVMSQKARDRKDVEALEHRPSTPFWSSLTVRIVALNLISLLIFMIGLILSSQFRTSSVDERLLALRNHSQFIAGALEQTALAERMGRGPDDPYDAIDRTAAVEILRRIVAPTEYRARIYDYDGTLIYDSWLLDEEGQVDAQSLSDGGSDRRFFTIIDEIFQVLMGPPLSPAHTDLTSPPPEVGSALTGETKGRKLQAVRRDENGDLIVSVAIPVKNVQAHVGAVLMSTQGDDFEALLWDERRAVFQVFLIALAVNIAVALAYASTIARPIRSLAKAADKIRSSRPKSGLAGQANLPAIRRRDEIGTLAASLRDMTEALNARMTAIEQFAADVSHEIKTPLTSLRSAVETLDLASTPEARNRLLSVIMHDVDRLDRLITDISNASRLDAELSREDNEVVSLPNLVRELIKIATLSPARPGVRIESEVLAGALGEGALSVIGIESRLGQVIQNLIDNAVSFSPEGGTVWVRTRRERAEDGTFVITVVEDEGPGIPEDSLVRIFERFYTQRPEEADFGKNSGLGLSISKQIVEVHGGKIWAENRKTADGEIAGARFVVRLPAIHSR